MKIKIPLLLIICHYFAMMPLFSQTSYFGIESGIHWYSMSELKSDNRQIQDELPFETDISKNYPPFVNFSCFYMVSHLKNVKIGLRYTYNFTGSEILMDGYSDKYQNSTKIRCQQTSLFMMYRLPINGKTWFYLSNDVGIEFNKLNRIEETFLYGASVDKTESSNKSKSLFWDPGMVFTYPLKNISIGGRIGYQIDLKKLTPEFLNKNGDQVRADWSGFHFSIFIPIPLKHNELM